MSIISSLIWIQTVIELNEKHASLQFLFYNAQLKYFKSFFKNLVTQQTKIIINFLEATFLNESAYVMSDLSNNF